MFRGVGRLLSGLLDGSLGAPPGAATEPWGTVWVGVGPRTGPELVEALRGKCDLDACTRELLLSAAFTRELEKVAPRPIELVSGTLRDLTHAREAPISKVLLTQRQIGMRCPVETPLQVILQDVWLRDWMCARFVTPLLRDGQGSKVFLCIEKWVKPRPSVYCCTADPRFVWNGASTWVFMRK